MGAGSRGTGCRSELLLRRLPSAWLRHVRGVARSRLMSAAAQETAQQPQAPSRHAAAALPPLCAALLQVQRAKKCLDFAGTLLLLHLIAVTCFSGFPKRLPW